MDTMNLGCLLFVILMVFTRNSLSQQFSNEKATEMAELVLEKVRKESGLKDVYISRLLKATKKPIFVYALEWDLEFDVTDQNKRQDIGKCEGKVVEGYYDKPKVTHAYCKIRGNFYRFHDPIMAA